MMQFFFSFRQTPKNLKLEQNWISDLKTEQNQSIFFAIYFFYNIFFSMEKKLQFNLEKETILPYSRVIKDNFEMEIKFLRFFFLFFDPLFYLDIKFFLGWKKFRKKKFPFALFFQELNKRHTHSLCTERERERER